ncbi:hypothetical protein ACHAWF_003074 [Thalassiosira exigua]
MSVGKVADDNVVSIFTKHGAAAYKENDVLITCKDEPILVDLCDKRGRYRVPLVQQWGQWQPRAPTKRVRTALERANSVYDLPSVEQDIKWMHAVCGYPVKSMWLKAIKAGNFQGWPLLNERNVNKYYPNSAETPKGHLNQTRKNVCSAKPLSDNRYLLVTVEIDSSAILIKPIKSRSDDELKRGYRSIKHSLNRANVFPKKHVVDNEVSEQMKDMIWDEFKMQLKLVLPVCHR